MFSCGFEFHLVLLKFAVVKMIKIYPTLQFIFVKAWRTVDAFLNYVKKIL